MGPPARRRGRASLMVHRRDGGEKGPDAALAACPPGPRARDARRRQLSRTEEARPMTLQEITDGVTELAQLDLDAIAAYDRALAALDDGPIAHQLAGFKLDHQRHVLELSQLLLAAGRSPPEARPDVKGAILGGVTALRSRLGTEQALAAMRTNESLTTSTYARMLARPFPPDVLEAVRRGYADEQRHLSWIERALDQRLWEQEAGAGISSAGTGPALRLRRGGAPRLRSGRTGVRARSA
ncbi:MAG: ferritin-like domain-containing protein [Anaeromyxobacter sp.]